MQTIYPLQIIPKTNYKIIDIEKLLNLENCIIVRRSLQNDINKTFNLLGKLRLDALVNLDSKGEFNVRNIIGYSCNLLGGHFEIKHIKFRQTKNDEFCGYAPWEIEEFIDFEHYKNCFEELEESIPIYFKLVDLWEKPIPFFSKDKEIVKKFGEAKSSSDNWGSEYKLLSIVNHVPTKLNFWHIEIDTNINIGKVKKNANIESDLKLQGYKVQISYHLLHNIISRYGFKTLVSQPSIIDENYYI